MNTRQNPPPSTRAPRQTRLSPEVYRRRRIAVLIILVMLLALIGAGVWAVKSYFFPSEQAPPEVVEEDPGPTVEQLANPVDCLPDAVELVPSLAADSIGAGQAANISVLIRNTGEVPCLVDMSKESVHAFITSGDDAVWASDHCGGGLPDARRLLLDIDTSDTTVISWPGTRSEAGCAGDQPKTKPGTYRLKVNVDVGAETLSEELVFGMH